MRLLPRTREESSRGVSIKAGDTIKTGRGLAIGGSPPRLTDSSVGLAEISHCRHTGSQQRSIIARDSSLPNMGTTSTWSRWIPPLTSSTSTSTWKSGKEVRQAQGLPAAASFGTTTKRPCVPRSRGTALCSLSSRVRSWSRATRRGGR